MFAWGGALLFAASLAAFAHRYLVVFADPAAAWSPRAVVWNSALFTLFAAHHSLFARLGLRDRVRAALGSQHERPAYVWAASLLFAGVCLAWRPVGGRMDWWPDWPWVQWPLLGVGALLTVGSARRVGVLALAGLRTEGPASFRAAGPYAWVRHPIYLGWCLFVFGVPHLTWTQCCFAVVSSVYVVIAIPWEERGLREAAGGDYAAYQRQVRWRLLPGLY